MPRCQSEIIRDLPCGDPIGKLGFVCVVCGRAACNRHSGDSEREMSACANCQRQCEACEAVKPANQGVERGNYFTCNECLGEHPVIVLGPLDVGELMPPLIPIHEESQSEVVA